MHTDILYIIIEYIDDYWFMKHFSFLYKDKLIEKRRKYLIRINFAKLLYKSTNVFLLKKHYSLFIIL